MKRIAIICGGDSSEHDVSLRSGAGIYSFFNKEQYDCYVVDLKKGDWHVNLPDGNTADIDKNDFSFTDNGEKKTFTFDYAYITIHGTPGETGQLQGYFDLIGLPYSTSSVLVEALTFDKFALNNYLRSFGISVADSILVRKGDESSITDESIRQTVGYPCFVKPAADGSFQQQRHRPLLQRRALLYLCLRRARPRHLAASALIPSANRGHPASKGVYTPASSGIVLFSLSTNHWYFSSLVINVMLCKPSKWNALT